MKSACSESDMATDSLAIAADTPDNVVAPVTGFNEAELTVAVHSGDGLDLIETTQLVDDQVREVAEQHVGRYCGCTGSCGRC